MPRAARAPSPTGLFHVTSRAIVPLRLFLDSGDCDLFLHRLARSLGRVRLYAFCLMGTHFHLVVRAEPDELADFMRRLKGSYAHGLNARRDRVGPVFDKRYHARPVTSERDAVVCIAYVELNAVRACLCHHPAQWPHSSYRANTGREPRPDWLAPLDELGIDPAAYRDLVDAILTKERSGSGLRPDPSCAAQPGGASRVRPEV